MKKINALNYIQVLLGALLKGAVIFLITLNSSSSLAQESRKNQLAVFKSDGCSLSPDGIWGLHGHTFLGCCVNHDIAYWKGGTPAERQAADKELKHCLRDQGYSVSSYVYYYGVRLGGSNIISTPFKWGYGWRKERGDEPLTLEEQDLVRQRLQESDVLQEFINNL